MTSDGELLRRYASTRLEDAFGELVRRHLNLVVRSNNICCRSRPIAQTKIGSMVRA